MTYQELCDLLQQAESLYTVGSYEQAEEIAKGVLKQLGASEGLYSMSEIAELRSSALLTCSICERHQGRYELALAHAQQSIALAEEHNFPMITSIALTNIGNIHMNRGDYPSALEYHNKSLLLNEKLGNKSRMAMVLGNVGTVYSGLGDYPQALEHYSKSLALHEEIGNSTGIAMQLLNIGDVYSNLSELIRALEYLNKALMLSQELGNKPMVATALCNMGTAHAGLADYPRSLEFFNRALAVDEELGNKAGVARSLSCIASVFFDVSDFSRSLEYSGRALAIYEEIGSKVGVAHSLNAIGNMHECLLDYPRALEYLNRALVLNEALGAKHGIASNLNNIAIVYNRLTNFANALEYMEKALALDNEIGDRAGVARDLLNLGFVYEKMGEHDRAMEYYKQSLLEFESNGGKFSVALLKGNIGMLYANQAYAEHDDVKAEENVRASIAINEEIGAKRFLEYQTLSALCKRQGRLAEALEYLEKYHNLKDEVQSEEAKKSAALIEQRRQIAEREKEIELARVAAKAELDATRTLLDSVLPTTIATRMIAGEERIADFFPSISILFADIVGFTTIAAEIPPDVVIEFLNHVFDIYDGIIKRCGCEKIKTIGDGYMAVSGAPVECADHAERIARAAIEMQNNIILPSAIQQHLPENTVFNIRIGIHTGAAVCGVVGKERFVWDVYSDAVNTASRMESNGIPGKIHVSREFAWLLRSRMKMKKDVEEFILEERGELNIKGKGLMKTYFLEKANL